MSFRVRAREQWGPSDRRTTKAWRPRGSVAPHIASEASADASVALCTPCASSHPKTKLQEIQLAALPYVGTSLEHVSSALWCEQHFPDVLAVLNEMVGGRGFIEAEDPGDFRRIAPLFHKPIS